MVLTLKVVMVLALKVTRGTSFAGPRDNGSREHKVVLARVGLYRIETHEPRTGPNIVYIYHSQKEEDNYNMPFRGHR